MGERGRVFVDEKWNWNQRWRKMKNFVLKKLFKNDESGETPKDWNGVIEGIIQP